MMSVEFGSPHLHIREPTASSSPSAQVRHRMAQRRVKPVGEWNLFIGSCHWRLLAESEMLAEDTDDQARIDAGARMLDGQRLTGFTLEAAARTATFAFDLGATLTTWPYSADNDEQWSLHRHNGPVLSYRTDGHCCLGSSSDKLEHQVWHLLSNDVRVSQGAVC